jgi:ribosomal protein S18 acetylase RimI-like enzyme
LEVRGAREDEITGFIDCYREIWESLRGILPDEYVEEVLADTGTPEFAERIRAGIADPERIILVAEEAGEVVGLAQGRSNSGGYSWLGFMGVSPESRRRGVARGILDEFIRISRERGCTKVSLDTAPCLKPAIKLYTEMGFIPEGYMRNHMHGLDLIFYSLFLYPKHSQRREETEAPVPSLENDFELDYC